MNVNELSVSESIFSILLFIILLLILGGILIPTYASNENKVGLNKSIPKLNDHVQNFSTNHQSVELGIVKLNQDNTKLEEDNYSNELSFNNQAGLENFSFTKWQDPLRICNSSVECAANYSTGWKDRTSIQISTNNTDNNRWKFVGQEVEVKPKERYEFVFHVKQNKWTTKTIVRLNGFNETTKVWDAFDRCPSAAISGLIEWREFRCGITILENISKIRPVLVPGESSRPTERAEIWFDSINLKKFRPFLSDVNLKTEVVSQGLKYPVSMAFLGPNDFLVTENNGTVKRIVNGVALAKPLLRVEVTGDGLLGIATAKNINMLKNHSRGPIYVFIHFVAPKTAYTGDYSSEKQMANRIYRYEFVNNSLLNGKLILDLPGGFYHDGGPILVAPDQNSLYLPVGDIENEKSQVVATKALNNKTGKEPDGTGGVLHVTLDGKPINETALGNKFPTNLYFSYGLRQSFGIDIDPVTGKLWDSENGANWGDEINLVERGFNGGWNKVQGIWHDHARDNEFNDSDITYNPSDLVDFDGKAKYRSPEFTWKSTVGPTAVKFVTSDRLGKAYLNNMFVGDVNNGRIYKFKLNHDRTAISLTGSLADKVADTDSELDDIVFASGFGIITDIKIGPDGYLYFVDHSEGRIYKIVPRF